MLLNEKIFVGIFLQLFNHLFSLVFFRRMFKRHYAVHKCMGDTISKQVINWMTYFRGKVCRRREADDGNGDSEAWSSAWVPIGGCLFGGRKISITLHILTHRKENINPFRRLSIDQSTHRAVCRHLNHSSFRIRNQTMADNRLPIHLNHLRLATRRQFI